MAKPKEYRNLTKKELLKKKKGLDVELIKAKTGMAIAKIGKKQETGKSGSDICKRIRKEIARILTILKENEINKR